MQLEALYYHEDRCEVEYQEEKRVPWCLTRVQVLCTTESPRQECSFSVENHTPLQVQNHQPREN